MGARGILRTVALLTVACVGAEAAARVWVGLRRPDDVRLPWGHEHPARAASNYVPHPFTGFALDPEFSEHSEQGLREAEILPREHEGLRIVALGGSNTYGTQVPAGESFPRVLERVLVEGGRRDIEVVNAGVGAYTTANLIGHLALRVLDLEPQLCLFDVGYTDAVARVRYAGFRSDYAHDYRAWTVPSRPLWRRSALLDGLARRLGHAYDPAPSIHDLAQLPSSPDLAANFAASSVEPFRRNLVSLIGICREHGVQPVLCTQAVDYEGHPVDEHDDLWREAMRQANAATRAVAAEHDVPLVDLATLLEGQSALFADERRMNAAGNARRAEEVARFLDEGGLLR